MARNKRQSPVGLESGFSLAGALFVFGVISAVSVFVFLSIAPWNDGNKGRHEDQDAIDARDYKELAQRYGMTVEEYLSDQKSTAWGDRLDWDGRTNTGWASGEGSTQSLFGEQLTPTYAPHLLGVARLRNLRGAVINPKAKKDRNLWPLNTDYDLYSMGKDGKTSTLLSADESQDDIIRANNGQYFGLASEY